MHSLSKTERTLTLCPECKQVVDGRLYEKAQDVYMQSSCPEHGEFNSLYFKDSKLYRAASRIADRDHVCRQLDCANKIDCSKHLEHTYNIMINLTQRCNMNCPVCFASTEIGADWPEPTPEEIFERLPDPLKKNLPNVVFIGGEPTLREDLPLLISGVAERGFIPRVSTNGLRLLEEGYAQRLADAGLFWVVLQFDGLTENAHLALRGRSLLDQKKQIIERCEKAGLAVQLAVMIDRNRNADQIADIIRFGFESPTIKWVNFYPRTNVNRDQFEKEEDLHVADMLSFIDKQTEGQITATDFLSMMRTLGLFYSVSKKEILRQKISTWPMVLVRSKGRIVPLPRLLNPRGIGHNRKPILTVLKSLPNLLHFQKMIMPDDILFMTMEKFHNSNSIDLCEAGCCHMAYMTRNGFVPFDIYNCLYREEPSW